MQIQVVARQVSNKSIEAAIFVDTRFMGVDEGDNILTILNTQLGPYFAALPMGTEIVINVARALPGDLKRTTGELYDAEIRKAGL
jgi:hypothetical protein